MAKIRSQQFAFQVQLMEPELVFRTIGFMNFVSTWLIRLVDPKKSHPDPIVEYVVFSLMDKFKGANYLSGYRCHKKYR